MNAKKLVEISGVWLTTYRYRNSIKNADLESKHYMRAYTEDDSIVMETIPEFNDSYMIARFSRDGNVLTGTWQETTSFTGDYKGAVYHGAAHLIISEDSQSIKGKWVGFGRKMDVKTGDWVFEYLGKDKSVIELVDRSKTK